MDVTATGDAHDVSTPVGSPSLFTPSYRSPHACLTGFHPIVAAWFDGRFSTGPTPPQVEAWPSIGTGRDVLVASPTGSGKTLTGFLVAIDQLWRSFDAGTFTPNATKVLYVSPLKALTADVRENLLGPLAEIEQAAVAGSVPGPSLTVGIRTGDSSAAERAALVRKPPELLVTTPESLYLLLTSAKGRHALRSVETVIVDEIHTLARDKRGVHLALTLERLSALVAERGIRLQRIGLSATQRPLSLVGQLLSGVGEDREPPILVDCGHARTVEVDVVLPAQPLEAVSSGTQFADVLDDMAEAVRQHHTTLIFVNTRRMAERVAHQLAERLGEDDEADDGLVVAAHHGSLSTARRRLVEARLRAGDLKALVATASLELGIDVGPVDLVCQLGSPRSIATFLQRIGRANHRVGGTPAGRLYPLTRDELVECTALMAAVRHGDLDLLRPPKPAMDLVVQQVVAEVAAREEVSVTDLVAMVRHVAPFADLADEELDEAFELAARGVMTGRGRRGAHLHLDAVNGLVRPAKGARLAALLNGGAIPETGDYRVVLEPDGVVVGQLNEDFAIESAPGDVFLLGTHAWRVHKVETSTVRVTDAGDAPPTVPFWIGEAPARTAELSNWVGQLRRIAETTCSAQRATDLPGELAAWAGVPLDAADQVAAYLAQAWQELGPLPTSTHLVVERFFDEVEGSQLVVHAPFGGRVNRALGLALRKRFCVTFDFELQAAADDDTVVISLGPHHSFPLTQVPRMVRSDQARTVLSQAVLTHPMLQARWRWNLNRSLVVARSMAGGRRPIHLQRMEAEDLLAATWPSLAACQENTPPGPIEIPDHLLVRQALADTLSEPMDIDGLEELLRGIESGAITVSTVESATPSVLAHGILTGRPYTFLDDAPLEERRTRAVPLNRGLADLADGVPGGSAILEPDVVARLEQVVAAEVRTADELADLLDDLVAARPVPSWAGLFAELVRAGRAVDVDGRWVAVRHVAAVADLDLDDAAAADLLRGHLERTGPTTLERLVADEVLGAGPLLGAPMGLLRAGTAIRRLEGMGLAVELPDGRWCARHLLARLHRTGRAERRRRVEAVPIAHYVEVLRGLQHVGGRNRLHGTAGIVAVVEQLQGLELPAGDWERQILAARIEGYRPEDLDAACLSGELTWARLTPRVHDDEQRRSTQHPSAATPLTLCRRSDLPWLLRAARGDVDPTPPAAGAGADCYDVLAANGPTFRGDLAALTGRLPSEVDEGLWDLVARGLVHADAFGAVRNLLGGTRRAPQARRGATSRLGLHRTGGTGPMGEGRWSLLPSTAATPIDDDQLAEEVATQLLLRWGVVTYEHRARESCVVPWRGVLRVLRRLEAQGVVRGGRFVAGISGEQFALVEVADALSHVDLAQSTALQLAASDPLNVTGHLLPGHRIPATVRRTVTVQAGTITPVEPTLRRGQSPR